MKIILAIYLIVVVICIVEAYFCTKEMDEHFKDHKRCIMCGDNDDCTCKEEWSQVSSCCEAKMEADMKMCYKCRDHCSSVWEEEVESCEVKERNRFGNPLK